MAREFAKSFYNSAAWKKCRLAYIAYRKRVDGGMCESCHEVAGYIVHHKTELTPENINNPDIALGFGVEQYTVFTLSVNYNWLLVTYGNKEGYVCNDGYLKKI